MPAAARGARQVEGDDLRALLASEGIVLDHYGAGEVEERLAAVMAERGYVVKEDDELSVAAKGEEQLAGILGAVKQLHCVAIEAFHLLREGEAWFEAPLAAGAGVLRVEAGAGDVVILPPGKKHRFGLGPERRLVMTGAYAKDPAELGPPTFFPDDDASGGAAGAAAAEK